jgi:hypothetical protein
MDCQTVRKVPLFVVETRIHASASPGITTFQEVEKHEMKTNTNSAKSPCAIVPVYH